MFSVSVCFGPVGTTWAFLFKTEESMEKAIHAFPEVPTIVDDFGQIGTFLDGQGVRVIYGYVVEDLSLSKLAHQERALHEARLRASVQQAAQTDPMLRTAMNSQGPGILQPVPAFRPR